MCNSETTIFTNLFLDLEAKDDDDDDDSLSSASSIEDSGGDAEETTLQDPEYGAKESDTQASRDDPPDVIEIDDNSVVEILSNTNTPSPPQRTQAQRPRAPKSVRDNEDTSRMRHKAKRLKKQNKYLEVKSKEIMERERKLLEDFSKTRERLEVMEQERQDKEDAAKSVQRELEHSKLMLKRLERERDTTEKQLSSIRKTALEFEEDLAKMHHSYQYRLKNADARAMKEVRELLDQHPKLVQENHTLKEVMAKKDLYIQALKRKVESLERSVHGRVDQEVREHQSRGNKIAKQVAKDYQEAREHEERRRQQEKLQQARRKESQSETVARVAGKNSAHASRVASAALHIASKPKRAMDVLDSASRKSTSVKPTLQSRVSSSSESDGSVLWGVSLNVSSAKKKRRIEPPPPTKRPAPQMAKRGGTNADIRKHFRTT
jgi:hypothetical protein